MTREENSGQKGAFVPLCWAMGSGVRGERSSMRSMHLRFLAGGWAEGLVGLVWFGSSLFSALNGRIPVSSTVMDAVAFLCLLVVLRWMRLGMACLIVAVLVSVGLDPEGRGVAIYLALCGLVAVVRAGAFSLAVPASVCIGGALFWISFRRSQYQEVIGVLVSTSVLCLVAWLIGLGFHAVGRIEAQRAARAFHERQLALAADMHDFVGRHLTNLIMHAELVRAEGAADPHGLDELVLRARLASRALREITSTLRGSSARWPRIGLEAALRQGIRDLEGVGFEVRQPAAWDGGVRRPLREEIDVASGRIVQEALHNASKHGTVPGPVVVAVERTADSLDIAVSNPTHGDVENRAEGMGLGAIRKHASVVGGTASFRHSENIWTCVAFLPLGDDGERR